MRVITFGSLTLLFVSACVLRNDTRDKYHLTLDATGPASAVVGTPFGLAVHAASGGMSLPSISTVLRITGGTAAVSQPGPTDVNGLATATVSANVAGTVTLELSSASLDNGWDQVTATYSVTFSATAPPPKIGPGVTSAFSFTGLSQAFQGQQVAFTVQAVDVDGAVTPHYTGSVTFSSTDSTAVLPGVASFAASDNGAHTMARALIFKHVGTQTLSATGVSSSFIAGDANVNVVSTHPTTVVLENRALPTNCLTLAGLNNQVGAQLSTEPCAYHSEQVFGFGIDGALHVAGYCVEVANAGYAEGAAVQLNTCNGAPEQGWTLSGNQIRSAGNANFCVDSEGSASVAPDLRSCSPFSASQQWQHHLVADTYEIINTTTSRVADVFGAYFANGSVIDSFMYNGSASQQFRFGADGTLSAMPANGNAVYCIDVRNGVWTNGANPALSACSGSLNQTWVQVGHTLRPQAAPGLCLDLNTAVPVGQSTSVLTCSGAPSQQVFLQVVSSHYTLNEKANTNLCVSTPASEAAGSVSVNTCAASTQQWLRQDGGTDAQSVYFRFAGGSLVLDAGPSPITAGNGVNLSTLAANANTVQWVQLPVGDGFAFIAENASSLTFDANSVTAGAGLIVNTVDGSDTQIFYKWAKSLTLALNAASTQCSGLAASPAVGTPVVVQPCDGTSAQQWVWMPISGALQNAGLCLDVASGLVAPGAALALAQCTAGSRQKWNNTTNFGVPNKWFNGAASTYCLDTNSLTVSGSPLLVEPCVGAATQTFIVRP